MIIVIIVTTTSKMSEFRLALPVISDPALASWFSAEDGSPSAYPTILLVIMAPIYYLLTVGIILH
jgi:hypothetical protein